MAPLLMPLPDTDFDPTEKRSAVRAMWDQDATCLAGNSNVRSSGGLGMFAAKRCVQSRGD